MHHVRGILFADYVRMLRRGWPGWREQADPETRRVLETRVEPDVWYPMADFERLGLFILDHVVGQEADAIRLWGRAQVQTILNFLPDLANTDDPRDSVMRFQNFFGSLFDFAALTLEGVNDEEALVRIGYGMSPRAEEAAAWQTVGFFEELIVASGGRSVETELLSRQWVHGEPTLARLSWVSALSVSPRPFLERPRVLLVDDEPLVGRALYRMLSKSADVTLAGSAADAVALLERRPFDAVVSDYQMPGRDGLSLLEEVAERWPHVRRVLHSGATPNVEWKAALELKHVHEVLPKPASYDVMIRAVSTKG